MKSSLFFWAKAFRRLPRRRRGKFFSQILPLLRESPPPPAAEDCVFDSAANYQKQYSRLAALLDRSGKLPPAGETQFLHKMLHRPNASPGTIGASDVFFLTAFSGILAPKRMIEIGTLTGFSAAVIAGALSRQRDSEGAMVETIDVRAQCLIDETKPTGFEIPELVPDLAPMIRLHIPHDSSFVRELAQPNELSVIFIDANHSHPFVLLDVLRVAPYLQKGGWILLHDIQLGSIGEKMRAAGQATPWGAPYGAEWLFQRWPFRKISGGNIGAIQVPNEKSALVPFALRLLTLPPEVPEKSIKRICRLIYESFGALL